MAARVKKEVPIHPFLRQGRRAPQGKQVREVRKVQGISVASFSAKGEKSTTSLPEAIFGQKPNRVLIAQAVRVYLSNQRSAQAKTKTRGEVIATTAKPYAQKGTGKARHGSKAAPIFVGGGIAHGPRGLQNYKLEISKKMRKSVLISALSAKAAAGQLFVADLDNVEPKTKSTALIFKKMGLAYPTTVVHAKSINLYKAARNIEGLNLVPADLLTAYQVLVSKSLVLTRGALQTLETRMIKEEK